MAKQYLTRQQARRRNLVRTGGAAVGITLLVLFLIASRLAVIGLAIWAIVWGVTDWANSGFNGWALAWIIIGGFALLSAVFTRTSSTRS